MLVTCPNKPSTGTVSWNDATDHWEVVNGSEVDTLEGIEQVVVGGQTYLLVDHAGAATGGYQTIGDATSELTDVTSHLIAAPIQPRTFGIEIDYRF